VNRNNTKTIGKHGEVVEKPLYKCISEGLMQVAAWFHGTPEQSSRYSANKFLLARPPTRPNFVAPTKSVRDHVCMYVGPPLLSPKIWRRRHSPRIRSMGSVVPVSRDVIFGEH